MNSLYLSYLLAVVSIVSANGFNDFPIDDYRQVQNSLNFTDKVVLTTGSSSGIGAAITKLFAILGAHVVITGINATQIKEVADEVQKLSPHQQRPLEVSADVTKTDELNKLLNETIAKYGKLDVLVNNAGIGRYATVKDKDFMKVFDQTIGLNLRAYVELSQLAVPYLERTNGTIICTSSMLSHRPHASLLAYDVSKAGVDTVIKVLALELGPKIRVNAVNPGFIESAFHSDLTPDQLKELMRQVREHTPLKRIGEPLDVAKGVVFLASSEAQFITGTNLFIDGGQQYNDTPM